MSSDVRDYILDMVTAVRCHPLVHRGPSARSVSPAAVSVCGRRCCHSRAVCCATGVARNS
jgi:hypothetical protein